MRTAALRQKLNIINTAHQTGELNWGNKESLLKSLNFAVLIHFQTSSSPLNVHPKALWKLNLKWNNGNFDSIWSWKKKSKLPLNKRILKWLNFSLIPDISRKEITMIHGEKERQVPERGLLSTFNTTICQQQVAGTRKTSFYVAKSQVEGNMVG